MSRFIQAHLVGSSLCGRLTDAAPVQTRHSVNPASATSVRFLGSLYGQGISAHFVRLGFA